MITTIGGGLAGVQYMRSHHIVPGIAFEVLTVAMGVGLAVLLFLIVRDEIRDYRGRRSRK